MKEIKIRVAILQWLQIICHVIPIMYRPGWLPKFKEGHPMFGFTSQEQLDFVVPFILILATYEFYFKLLKENIALFDNMLFLFGAILLTEGHGIHLAANAIDRYLSGPCSASIFGSHVAHYYDETMGHHVWYSGEIVVGSLLMYAEYYSKNKDRDQSSSILLTLILCSTSIMQGLLLFMAYVEGQTVKLGYTYCVSQIILYLFMLFASSDKTRFIVMQAASVSCGVCLICMSAWGYYFKGTFPEFSILGWGHFYEWSFSNVVQLFTK